MSGTDDEPEFDSTEFDSTDFDEPDAAEFGLDDEELRRLRDGDVPDDGVHDDGVHHDEVHDDEVVGVLERAMPEDDEADAAFIRAAEARNAIARAAAITAGRRKGGVAGAALAGAMFAVAEIYEGPRKEQSSVVVEASSDPNDLDADGLELTVGEVSVAAPALERLEPVSERDSRKRPVV